MKLLFTFLLPLFLLAAQSDIKEHKQDVTLLEKACDAGEMSACNDLGIAYAKGYGVKRDQIQATKLFAKACVSNIYDACYNLGEARVNGKGVRKNTQKAKALFKKACEGGHQQACQKLK